MPVPVRFTVDWRFLFSCSHLESYGNICSVILTQVCKAKFYKSKIEHMKKENPRAWWKEVKRLCGGQCNPATLTNHIQAEGVEDLSMKELADAINVAFLDPLEEYPGADPDCRKYRSCDRQKFHKICEFKARLLERKRTLLAQVKHCQ